MKKLKLHGLTPMESNNALPPIPIIIGTKRKKVYPSNGLTSVELREGGLSYKRNTCRLCGSKDLELALSLTPIPISDAYIPSSKLAIMQPIFPLDLLLCLKCGNSQLRDVVNPKLIYRDYIYEATSSLGFVTHFQRYANWAISKFKPAPGSLVVDIGSNDGTLLRFFKNNGMKVLGIDPATRIAKAATKSGIETLPEFFTVKLAKKIMNKYGKANIVTCNNLYANIDNLGEFTSAIKELMDPNGIFIFESFYLLDTMKNMVFDFIYHEHFSYFSAKPLASFLDRNGMELIDVQRIPTKGGSVRYTVQLAGGTRKKSLWVNKLISQEKKNGIHTLAAFKKFLSRINKAKNDLLTVIQKLKKEGKTIAGYGASAQSTTFIYHFNLTDKLEFIVDDYKRKHFTFSPGCHIPVFPSSGIYRKKPDVIVIIAWRYYKPIIEKHKQFLTNGGIFIIPLPKLKIIRKN